VNCTICAAELERPDSLAAGTCYECRLSAQMPPTPICRGCDRPWVGPPFSFCDLCLARIFRRVSLPQSATEVRFWAKVDRTGDCWLWLGAKNDHGYGHLYVSKDHHVYAHRYAYELLARPIPAGLTLDHRRTCPKNCVRPEHLRPATPKQNGENRAGPRRDSSTGVRGVFWTKRGRLRVQVVHRRRAYSGGVFDSIALAEKAAVRLRNRLHTHNDADRPSRDFTIPHHTTATNVAVGPGRPPRVFVTARFCGGGNLSVARVSGAPADAETAARR